MGERHVFPTRPSKKGTDTSEVRYERSALSVPFLAYTPPGNCRFMAFLVVNGYVAERKR